MSIEEQIAQLQAMYEALQPVKQAAQADFELALAAFQPKQSALENVCAQMEAINGCVKHLCLRQTQIVPTPTNELLRRLNALPTQPMSAENFRDVVNDILTGHATSRIYTGQ